MSKDLKVLTLKKSEWMCPDHPYWDGNSGLYIEFENYCDAVEGAMCCLGTLAHKLGTSQDSLIGHAFPSSLVSQEMLPSSYPTSLLDNEEAIAEVNDNMNLTLTDRLKYLSAYFKEVGYKLMYVDDWDEVLLAKKEREKEE